MVEVVDIPERRRGRGCQDQAQKRGDSNQDDEQRTVMQANHCMPGRARPIDRQDDRAPDNPRSWRLV